MRRVLSKVVAGAVVLAIAGAAAFWFLTEPERLRETDLAEAGSGDAARGERIFWAGGCTSCHARPGSQGDARLQLAGGLELKTPFGAFVAPNISPDPKDGIGNWSFPDFANAMLKGVSPSGHHYYPAFPYASYARMAPSDVADLFAFMKTLPAVSGQTAHHTLSFPLTVRRGIGLWKRLYLGSDPVIALPDGTPENVLHGRYLVEGPGHCGECHTPRDFLGGTRKDQWLAGAVAAEGKGTVSNITSGEGGIGSWSEGDIAYYLETGFTPDFDSVGGSMVEVQKNMARLTADDRAAIAAYLKAAPPRPNGYPAPQTTGAGQ
ncbi:cytochrome c [Pseudaminobacter sp. 19-2017]|uniref:Cytochrome c n=1 Tax=Pseudaminobacter soli (ex Zhang et al. 2022) TaxID=2831468 RepID=A0A942DZD1_9HYPH|nr:cytochrome c [Pseudaminobacter soli]MBS3648176.1 cytochrome c [Pseudaminobacter soli]